MLALLVAAAGADGERTQRGELIVSLDGGLSPRRLPRHRTAPVSLRLAGELRTADGSPLPRLRRIELDLAGSGALETRGLPLCPRRKLIAADPATALAVCGAALIGRGSLRVAAFIPGQRPFNVHASLRAFNGRLAGGRRVAWLHVYTNRPVSSFVLPFVIHRRSGAFATALTATVPRGLGPWPHLARFSMTLGRRYGRRGARSYIGGSCPLPPRFSAGFFPLARATYELSGGTSIATEIVRGCRVREG